MNSMDPAVWPLYVNEFVDRKITPFGLGLLQNYLSEYPNKKKRPKTTKVQGIYQRSLAIKSPAQAFLSALESAGFKQMRAAWETSSNPEKGSHSSGKSAKDQPIKISISGEQSFEAFLLERRLLEERRGQKADEAFYQMVQDALTGEAPLSAKRAAAQLVTAAKLEEGEQKFWREWTQIHLLHAWVDLLCLRILPDLEK